MPNELHDDPLATSNLYGDANSRPHAKGWIQNIREESQSLKDHDLFPWIDVPLNDVKAISSKFVLRWKYDKDGKLIRRKNRLMDQGFHQLDTGEDTAAISRM